MYDGLFSTANSVLTANDEGVSDEPVITVKGLEEYAVDPFVVTVTG